MSLLQPPALRTPVNTPLHITATCPLACYRYASAHGTAVIRLTYMPPPQPSVAYNVRPIDERGWCVFEMYVAMIVVGTDTQDRNRHETPKLLDATGGAVPELVTAPTPEEFAARLDRATFTVPSDVARAKQYYLDYYLENGVGGRARLAMVEYQRRGQERRQRIRRRVLAVGLPMCALGLLFDNIPGELSIGGLGSVCALIGIALSGLSLQPDERRVVRALSVAAVVGGYVAALLFVRRAATRVESITVWVHLDNVTVAPVTVGGVDFDTNPPSLYPNDPDRKNRTVSWIINAAVLVATGTYVLLLLFRRMLTRVALHRLIGACRFAMGALAVIDLVGKVFSLATSGIPGRRDRDSLKVYDFVADTTAALLALLLTFSFTPSVRLSLQAWFARLGSSKQAARAEREAAALAALVGGGGRQVDDAASSFRLLPIDGLEQCDLPGSGTGPADAAALRKRTTAAALGAPNSVFVSHSWHDPREAKWAALRAWTARYEAERGAAPMLWLDAACVAQDSSTDRSLAMLPLYIAGCQRMVVLAGDTFLERLWCVIEIFCFLRMGGSRDRITVVPVLDATDDGDTGLEAATAAAMARFALFDVANARCAMVEDTQRLLACIEMGFGKYEPFNQLVRQTFQDRTEFVPVREAARRRRSYLPAAFGSFRFTAPLRFTSPSRFTSPLRASSSTRTGPPAPRLKPGVSIDGSVAPDGCAVERPHKTSTLGARFAPGGAVPARPGTAKRVAPSESRAVARAEELSCELSCLDSACLSRQPRGHVRV